MDINKFNALIRLLDDEDLFVYQSVKSELLSLDNPILHLEKAKLDCQNNRIVETIDSIIEEISLNRINKNIDFENFDLMNSWIELSSIFNPSLDSNKVKNEINKYVDIGFKTIKSNMMTIHKLTTINKILYNQRYISDNFAKNSQNYFDLNNNFIDHLLTSKKGNAMSLCLLYYHLARQFNIDIHFISFQGHYVLCCFLSKTQWIFIETIDYGIFLTSPQVSRYLDRLGIDNEPSNYPLLTEKDMFTDLCKIVSTKCIENNMLNKANIVENILKNKQD